MILHPVAQEGITKQMTLDNQPGYNPAYRSSHDHLLFLTFGAALTIGCLAGIYIRRRPRRPESSRPDEIDNLSGISADMGINEYDLFHKAAENWAVPAERIEEDFSAYLATQRLPYYVTDYARKSHSQPDEMPTEKETEPKLYRALLVQAIALCPEPLVALQAEYHPYLDQSKLLACVRQHGLVFFNGFKSFKVCAKGSYINSHIIMGAAFHTFGAHNAVGVFLDSWNN